MVCLPSDRVQIHDGQYLSNQKTTNTLIFEWLICAFFVHGDPYPIHCNDCILVSTSYP
jgi:hypothetical protein